MSTHDSQSKAVLIVDDDRIIRERLEKELKRNFFKTFQANNGKSALEIFSKEKIDILLLDVKLPDMSGLTVLQKVKEQNPGCEVVVITGFGTQEIAIQALKWGAIDYIEKPIKMQELNTALGRAQEKILEKGGFRHTLLVIDDDPMVTKWLKKILTKEGYDTLTASNGREGIEIVENNRVDVIITDIKMADMDGIKVLQNAKKLYHDIEGIMVTGYKDQELAIKSLRAGAIDYITKPVNLDELLFSVTRAIERINLSRNRLYRNRELKISTEIISKMNEELERRMQEKAQELSQTQAQLFQTSKLATLGEMAAGLAHEINQPLGGISLIAKHFRKLMDRNKLDTEELNSGLTDIEASVKRMSKIIQHIRTFARQDTLKFLQVDVNDTIDSALNLLGQQLRLHQISVTTNVGKDVPKIYGEPYQLEQVWINIISNARDAVDEKEKQQEEPAGVKSKKFKKNITISTSFNSNSNTVTVTFKDNGIGIPGEFLDKVFEPFYTTKEVGKATGLGLAISYGIIESHSGKIKLESKEGNGSSFSIILPMEDTND